MTKSALVILHQGVEEMEAIAPTDILRRGGISVTTASCSNSLEVEGKSGIKIKADVLLDTIKGKTYDGLILPGGPGVSNLLDNKTLIELIQDQHAANRWIGAICAAPLLLKEAGILKEHRFTAHASVQGQFESKPLNQRVVVDHPLITSPGAGAATAFAFALLTALGSPQIAREVAIAIHWYPKQDWQARATSPHTTQLFQDIKS